MFNIYIDLHFIYKMWRILWVKTVRAGSGDFSNCIMFTKVYSRFKCFKYTINPQMYFISAPQTSIKAHITPINHFKL